MLVLSILAFVSFCQVHDPIWEYVPGDKGYCLTTGMITSSKSLFSFCYEDQNLDKGYAFLFNYESNQTISKIDLKNGTKFLSKEDKTVLTMHGEDLEIRNGDLDVQKTYSLGDDSPYVHMKNDLIALSHNDDSNLYYEVVDKNLKQTYSHKEKRNQHTSVNDLHFFGEKDLLFTRLYHFVNPGIEDDYIHTRNIVDYSSSKVSDTKEIEALPFKTCYAGNFVGVFYQKFNYREERWFELNEYKNGKLEQLFKIDFTKKEKGIQTLMGIQVDSKGYSYILFNIFDTSKKDYPFYFKILKLKPNGDEEWEVEIGKEENYKVTKAKITQNEKFLAIVLNVGPTEKTSYGAAVLVSTDEGKVSFVRKPTERTYFDLEVNDSGNEIELVLVGEVGNKYETNKKMVIEFFKF